MLESGSSQSYPSPQEIVNLTADLSITYEELQNEAVGALLEAMRYVFANGGAQFASFILGPSPVLDYFAPRDRLDEIRFWSRMLQTPEIVEALPWLGDIYIGKQEIVFHPLSAYYLDGDLAETLMKGGAYRHFSGTAEEAKQVGLDFCAAVFENRYDELTVRKTKDVWANWFMHTPWDNTWFGLDRRARRFWILCATDTD
jgi:hypothetical protein